MAKDFIYNFSQEPTGTHRLLLDEIKPGSRVLDVGSASGYMGEYIIREKNGTVWGIEPFEPAAAEARTRGYAEIIVSSVEEALTHEKLSQTTFDYIVVGDVLEHLLHPENVLVALQKFLAPGGKLLVSIPNVGHYSVRWSLFIGRWDMQDSGILDRTHLHFYTRKTALALLTSAGWEVESVRPRGDLERWFRRLGLEFLGKKILFLFSGLFAVQFIFVARSK